jgi:hypothetical protein
MTLFDGGSNSTELGDITFFDDVSTAKDIAVATFYSDETSLIGVGPSLMTVPLIATIGEKDLLNPWLATLVQRSRAMWANRGNYAGDFQVRLKTR